MPPLFRESFRGIVLASAMFSLCATPSYSDDDRKSFQVDIPFTAAAKAAGHTLVADLAVQDKVYVYFGAFCLKNDVLSLSDWTQTITSNDYTFNAQIEILPGQRVAVELISGKQVKSREKLEYLVTQLFALKECDDVEINVEEASSKFYTLVSIDGATRLSDFLVRLRIGELSPETKDDAVVSSIRDTLSKLPKRKSTTWYVSKSRDPIDDSPKVFASKKSVSASVSSYGRQAELYIQCKRNTTSLIVNADEYMSDDKISLSYRIDAQEAVNAKWTGSTSNRSAGLWSGSESIPMIKQLVGAEKFVVEFKPRRDAPILMVFELDGIKEAAVEVAKACNWQL